MAFTEFCCRSGGSNLNAGTRTGNSTEPGTAADLTYASGTWVAATGVFTPASGDPVADGVAVGDFASVYANGATTTGFVGRVTARTTLTITVSLTAKAGTAPTDGAGDRTLKIGGAWAGPNGADIFPFGVLQITGTTSTGNSPRVNLKNAASYGVSASCAHSNTGPATWQGYATNYGDLGKATIDAGANAVVVVSITGTSNSLYDLIAANNGSTNVKGIVLAARAIASRVVAHDIGGVGIDATNLILTEAEAYKCNASNTSGVFAIVAAVAVNCIAHDNDAGANANGIDATSFAVGCIADSNAGIGIRTGSNANTQVGAINCDAYNNGSDGIRAQNGTSGALVQNCNAVKNGGFGINISSSSNTNFMLNNNGFGSGSEVNTSGAVSTVNASAHSFEVGSVTYASGLTPWVDPVNGDFRINLAAAKGAGRGAYTQTAASYAGAVAYPDVGAVQSQPSVFRHPGMSGGIAG